MSQILLLTSGIMLTATFMLIAARSWQWEQNVSRRRQRLAAHIPQLLISAGQEGPGITGSSMVQRLVGSGGDARVARWLPGAAALRDMLERTGRPISLTRYAGQMGLVAAIVSLGCVLVTPLGAIGGILVGTACGILLPFVRVRRRASKRLTAFTQQFPDALDLIVRALRAGLPLAEALHTVSQESMEPISTEFRKAVGAMALSRSADQALSEIERTIDSPELRFFIISISLQVQTGGNLGETLGKLATILRQRSQMKMKIRAMTGEARASAAVLGLLPFVIGLLMFFTNKNYIAPLFSDPRGWIMLAAGGMMLTVGLGIMAKLVSFKI